MTSTKILHSRGPDNSAAAIAQQFVANTEQGPHEPGDDEPGDDEPGDDEPGDDEPGDDEPGDDEPGDDEPGDDEPAPSDGGSSGADLPAPAVDTDTDTDTVDADTDTAADSAGDAVTARDAADTDDHQGATAEDAVVGGNGRAGAWPWCGDTAYGTGDLRAAITDAGHDAVIKPKPVQPAVAGGFTLDEFTVDEDSGTVTCPAGRARPGSANRTVTFGVLCRDCPLRARCTTAKTGRSLDLHEHDALLRAARADWAADPALREDYRHHRPNVERTVSQVATQSGRRIKAVGDSNAPDSDASDPHRRTLRGWS